MAVKGTIEPGSISARIIEYLTDKPGPARAPVIAAALGLPTQQVANVAGKLARNGHVQRVSMVAKGKTRGTTVFAALGTYSLPEHDIRLRR